MNFLTELKTMEVLETFHNLRLNKIECVQVSDICSLNRDITREDLAYLAQIAYRITHDKRIKTRYVIRFCDWCIKTQDSFYSQQKNGVFDHELDFIVYWTIEATWLYSFAKRTGNIIYEGDSLVAFLSQKKCEENKRSLSIGRFWKNPVNDSKICLSFHPYAGEDRVKISELKDLKNALLAHTGSFACRIVRYSGGDRLVKFLDLKPFATTSEGDVVYG